MWGPCLPSSTTATTTTTTTGTVYKRDHIFICTIYHARCSVRRPVRYKEERREEEEEEGDYLEQRPTSTRIKGGVKGTFEATKFAERSPAEEQIEVKPHTHTRTHCVACSRM